MAAWLLEEPPKITSRHRRYLIRIEDGGKPETTTQPLLAKRFATAQLARAFATAQGPELDEFRIVRR